jgi:hypothetical protein
MAEYTQWYKERGPVITHDLAEETFVPAAPGFLIKYPSGSKWASDLIVGWAQPKDHTRNDLLPCIYVPGGPVQVVESENCDLELDQTIFIIRSDT